MMKNSYQILAILSIKGIGPKNAYAFINEILEKKSGKLEIDYIDFFESKNNTFKKLVENNTITIENWKSLLEKSQRIVELSSEKGIKTISFLDSNYPRELQRLDSKPLILFAKGNVSLLNNKLKLAVVGTRNPSVISKKMIPRIVRLFLERDFVIVSGLAKGCDALAHESALSGGKTIAILAHGLDLPIYPKENRELADRILDSGGLLISEYPIGRKLQMSYLVQRDEWQSGISSGLIFIESSLNGGTRHAVGKAIEQEIVLGTLDISSFKDAETFNFNGKFDLNKKYINENKADRLYTKKSFINFLEKVIQKSNFIYQLAEENEEKIIYKQTELF